jgi:CHAT domain-containing protein/Flp pilus assembly protein TadD
MKIATVIFLFFITVFMVYSQTADDGYSYNSKGLEYFNQSDYKKAETSFLKAKDIFEKVFGKENADYAAVVDNLGYLYTTLGDYAKAEIYYLEDKTIKEKIQDKNTSDYAFLLLRIGLLYRMMGNFSKSEIYLIDSKNVYAKTVGKEHIDYARVLNGIGLLYLDTGDYIKSEASHLEAKAIREKTLGKEHPDYAVSLQNLGRLYHITGDYIKAETYLLEAKATLETFGKNKALYATTLNNLGALYCDTSDYAKAERYYLEAKNIYEKLFGKKHPQYALELNNLGMLYQSIGNYTEALDCFYEVIFICEDTLGKEHPYYVGAVGNAGLANASLKDYTRAEKYYLEAKSIIEKIYGKEHDDYAMSLNNLGVLYSDTGDYAKAELYYLEAKSVYEKLFGKKHPDYALELNNLGVLYRRNGNFAKAAAYHLESKTIYEKLLGKENTGYINKIDNLFLDYVSMKKYSKAEVFNDELCKLTITMTNRNFTFMSELQRSLYWNTKSNIFETSYSLAYFNSTAKLNSLNYNNALFSKGLLLRTTNAIRDAIYSSGNTALVEQFEKLRDLRAQIAALQQKEGSDQTALKNLKAEADNIDKALSRQSTAFRDLKTDIEMQWQDVQKSLKPDEAAVEFVSFQLYDKKWTDKTFYAALVLRPKMKSPVWVPLCEENQLKEILAKAGGGRKANEQIRIMYDIFGGELYATAWKPLEEHLKGVKTLYYSPSGLLHKIAFGALPDGTGRLEDKYILNLVSSTREVVHFVKNNTDNAQLISAVLYGGLKYDTAVSDMQTAAKKYKTQNATIVPGRYPAELTRGAAWVELPATREEILMIDTYLKRNKISYTLYQGSSGNEESFKSLNGKKTGLIHFATHGFFLNDVERQRDDTETQRGISGASREANSNDNDNPLLRSGLLLSGGNNAWTRKKVEGIEDGILTADEISRLNLLGAKLVVLSACQTGLGDIKNGEGVFGLQRAFKLAGVETLIMSLWEVDDAATAKLMSTFYTEWLSGKSKQEAFKEARRQVRAEYPAPYYWAAFVMMD